MACLPCKVFSAGLRAFGDFMRDASAAVRAGGFAERGACVQCTVGRSCLSSEVNLMAQRLDR